MKWRQMMSDGKVLIAAAAGVALALLWIGCETHPIEEEAETWENPYAVVGRVHNESLDAIYMELQDRVSQNPMEGDFYDVLGEAIISYGKKRGLDDTSARAAFQQGWRIATEEADVRLGKRPRSLTMADSLIHIKADEPERVASYAMRLQAVITEEDGSRVGMARRVSELEKQASENLSEKDVAIVLSGTAVGINSWAYWEENTAKWVSLFRQMQSDSVSGKRRCFPDFHRGRIVWADATGGVVSGAIGGVAYAFRLASRAAWAGGIVTGLASASLMEMSMQYYGLCIASR